MDFNQKLANDDIDVPDDFYNEQILFTKPEELMNIFEELQEINLDRIQKSQENEEILEKLKAVQKEQDEEWSKKISNQEILSRDIKNNYDAACIVLQELRRLNKQDDADAGQTATSKK